MRMRTRLVWKLSAVVVAILAAAITLSGYLSNLICAHSSLVSAREVLKFNSRSIVNGIGQLMMSRNIEAIEELIVQMSGDSTVYGDIRLVAHPSGEVVVSRFDEAGRVLEKTEEPCIACHQQSEPADADTDIHDLVVDDPGGGRMLSVMVPILNGPSCRDAACHVHADSPPVLGFLSTDYSLQHVDAMVGERRFLIGVTVLVSLLFGVVALWIMFTRLLARPIRDLIAGTERIAAGQYDFRFDQKRSDEIGVLQESFNTMATRVRSHRDELRATLEYVGGIVENSADIIITVTADGFIETFNRGAEQALGYGRSEVIGEPVEMLFADPRQREVAIRRLQESGSVQNYETRFLTKDGRTRNVLLTLSYLRDRAGNPIGTFGISKDITKEKELLRELVQSKKLVAIGQAVTGIQHAVKNMLNTLKGGAYLARIGMSKGRPAQIEEGFAMVEEGIERIAELSRHMLNFAREWTPEREPVDISELLDSVCDANRQAAEDGGVALLRDLPKGLPAVPCDPKLIHMALMDIVVNAIDACAWKDYPEGESPEVAVRIFLNEGRDVMVIEVRDNGCGMSDEISRDIFTPFFSTKKWGTGLGLALTARIVKMHGGEVNVKTEPDRGSTFRIHLPAQGPSDRKEPPDGETGSHH